MFIDTHAHLDVEQYNKDREQVIENAAKNGVDFIINPSFDLKSAERAVALATDHSNIFAAVGCHPKTKEESGYAFDKKDYAKIISEKKVVAIGECGLEGAESDQYQQEVFKEQISLSKEYGLPLIIHCRLAHKKVIEMLSKEKNLRGVIHCFSGSLADAQKYLEMGFFISFTGIITYANDYDKVIKNVPLEKILIETDCPYLSPSPFRGQRNEPANLKYIAQRISLIKNETIEEIGRITSQNSINLFNLS